MIHLEAVGHVYGVGTPWAHRALQGVDLRIGAGERVLVAGGNGSGKSTLAWILAGLTRPTEGRALLGSKPLHEATGGQVVIGFQHARLQLFRPTVREDIRYGTNLDGDGVDDALAAVGLDPEQVRERRVDELSGGQQRRVALAGLLVRHPKLLVLDEPLAGLDRPSRTALLDLLAGLTERTGAATVVVSHDLENAEALADRLVVLEAGEVTHDGPIDGVRHLEVGS